MLQKIVVTTVFDLSLIGKLKKKILTKAVSSYC